MSYQQATINKIYHINIQKAVGSLQSKYDLDFLDYSCFENGIISTYSSNDGEDIHYFLNDKHSEKPLTTAKRSGLLKWESYCSTDFLKEIEKKTGYPTQGICILRINKYKRERLSLSSKNMDFNFYQHLKDNKDLQDNFFNRTKKHIKSLQIQPIELSINLPAFSNLGLVKEDIFQKLESNQLKKKFILNTPQAHNDYSTIMSVAPNQEEHCPTLWDLKALESISTDLEISVETVQAYIQLLRRKEAKLFESEIDCLHLAAQGYTAKETAKTLKISVHTVREYRQSLIKKLDADNITHAIYLALKKNILS